MKGLSTKLRCTLAAPCLRQSGVEFVVRYYSETNQQTEKILTPQEARAIDHAGLRLAAVYQDRQNQVADFSREAGERDGRFAFQYAREVGQPLGTTIFFAVDYDADPGDMNRIISYFRGVSAGLEAAAGRTNAYLIGVFGSGYTCRRLEEAGVVSHTWLCSTPGYRESDCYEDWDVKQFEDQTELCDLPRRTWKRCESKGADVWWSFRLGGNVPQLNPRPEQREQSVPVLRRGGRGSHVHCLQRLLNRWLLGEGACMLLEDGFFGGRTEVAVRAFQSSHVDAFGLPLVVDAVVGGLTWGALKRVGANKPDPSPPALILPVNGGEWWKKMPPESFGGSVRGRAALRVAVEEAAAGRAESGGPNMGPQVLKYLNGLVRIPADWCAGFVCWCLQQSGVMPFKYTLGAKDLRAQAMRAGLMSFDNPELEPPKPGDLIVWWRHSLLGWRGQVGFVHHVADGRVYTLEGNRTSRVEGFSYPLTQLSGLTGFIRL
jgi:peptidoglycan hydrolase-like protein with peptidoglycan-binding domain